jgi:hypothetical protein
LHRSQRRPISSCGSVQHLLQGGDQPCPLRQPRNIGREAWVGGQFLPPEFLDKPPPLLVAGDADEQLATGCSFENLVDRPGAAPELVGVATQSVGPSLAPLRLIAWILALRISRIALQAALSPPAPSTNATSTFTANGDLAQAKVDCRRPTILVRYPA